MNTLTHQSTPSRVASLDPFEIVLGAASCPVPYPPEWRNVSPAIGSETPKRLEEFGCVDWYQYPSGVQGKVAPENARHYVWTGCARRDAQEEGFARASRRARSLQNIGIQGVQVAGTPWSVRQRLQ